MKRVLFSAVMALVLTGSLWAADGEWTAKVEKEGDKVVAKVGEKSYELKGAAAKDLAAGEYVIKGTISADGKSIEVTEAKKK